MAESRRSELIFKGMIDVAGTPTNAELRSNGRVWAVMSNGVVLKHFIEPEVTFDAGLMVITGTPPGELAGVTSSWRVQHPEIFDLTLTGMTVKTANRPDLKLATVSSSQYRVRIIAEDLGVDLSLPGARLDIINGKRAIIDGDGTVYMLEDKDCGCGTKK